MNLPWNPPVELSTREQMLKKSLKKRKFFIFLREYRHIIFDEETQKKLSVVVGDHLHGKKPVPPALLAMATLLQAYTQLSDADVIEACKFDLRWQMILDCLGDEKAPFSQGTLQNFRERLIAHNLDKFLIDRSVAIAKETGAFGAANLRLALDSSPLWGAGRVEDSFNLLGRALREAVAALAQLKECDEATVCEKFGLPKLTERSIKALLDCDWSLPNARQEALQELLSWLESFQRGVQAVLKDEESAQLTSLPEIEPLCLDEPLPVTRPQSELSVLVDVSEKALKDLNVSLQLINKIKEQDTELMKRENT